MDMTQDNLTQGLSILVPQYNFNTTPLVSELLLQADTIQLPIELIVIDDASPSPTLWDEAIRQHPKFHYVALSKNIGRSRIRNLLADSAHYKYLLFIDCDSEIPPLFLKKYTSQATPFCVVAGGTRYSQTPPSNRLLQLHWRYGTKIETIALQKSELFHSNNFMIDQTLFQQIRFDEMVAGYGHEDTFFRIALQQHGATIRKIDNPVYHIGLNTTEIFLRNTRNAIDNLLKHPQYQPTHPIIRLNRLAQKTHLTNPLKTIFRHLAPHIERKVEQTNPSITLYKLYKLLYILSR